MPDGPHAAAMGHRFQVMWQEQAMALQSMILARRGLWGPAATAAVTEWAAAGGERPAQEAAGGVGLNWEEEGEDDAPGGCGPGGGTSRP